MNIILHRARLLGLPVHLIKTDTERARRYLPVDQYHRYIQLALAYFDLRKQREIDEIVTDQNTAILHRVMGQLKNLQDCAKQLEMDHDIGDLFPDPPRFTMTNRF
jgi:hypothetical protein